MKLLQRVCCLTVLSLTVSGCVSVPRVEESLNSLDLDSGTYVVRAGDTLESIAFRYKLSPNELAALNPDKGRHFAAGTHLNIRSASNARESYRSEAAWAEAQQPAAASAPRRDPYRDERDDRAVVSRVETPRAVPQTQPQRHEVPENRSVFTPAVNAVVSDVTLLDTRKPYRRPEAPVQEIAPETPQPMVPRESTFAGREIVEEEYAGNDALLDSRGVSDRLQPLVGSWTWPTQGPVARGFAPIQEGRHGVDIAGVPGQPVVAVKDGVVAYSGKDPSGSGNLIIVKHDGSLLTAYSHTKDLYVAENDTVRAGDPIGTLGWNAQQESVLRFEVRKDGNSLNPMDFLSAR
ncbi:peptidoglycan DD-metalloendopeptidase family protein [Granulosicoccus sp. 3-233]|uniref:peptidoglycan DD-metalloendopeptidase family protein n=1 Tax=Granulosicoccus sp. 3-233 TaxID=3417969 RepID=UPI003D33228D